MKSPRGTISEFQVEGKAIALANVGGKFLCHQQYPACIGAGRWAKELWTETK